MYNDLSKYAQSANSTATPKISTTSATVPPARSEKSKKLLPTRTGMTPTELGKDSLREDHILGEIEHDIILLGETDER